LPSHILRDLVQTLHGESTLAFIAHLPLIFYRTIETDVKRFAVLNFLQFLLIDLPLKVREALWLIDRVFWHVPSQVPQMNERVY
jgi:hypothetical protein